MFEVVAATRRASGKEIPVEFVDRRAGDIGVCCAGPSRAEAELGWKAQYGLDEMCADAWRWQCQNPNDYAL